MKIVATGFFKEDYEKITGSLLNKWKSVDYENSTLLLFEIADSKIFETIGLEEK